MEQKLAEFRARRQAENAVKNERIVAPLKQAETVDTRPETTSTSGSGRVEIARDSPQTLPTKVWQYSSLKFTVTFCSCVYMCIRPDVKKCKYDVYIWLAYPSDSSFCRTVVTGSLTVLWEDGWLPGSPSSQTWLCSNSYCGWCCSDSLLNWSLACRSLSSLCSTGFTKGSAAQLLVSLESWAHTRSSTQTVNLCWAHWLQSSWRGRWVTDLWLTDKDCVVSMSLIK